MLSSADYPQKIEIYQMELGYVAKLNNTATYFKDYDTLVEALKPRMRAEFETCKGSC